MERKERAYNIVRVVIEEFQVSATSKKDAATKYKEPHKITVKSEKITLAKP